MLVLGIDPGLARTGWGLVKKKNSQAKAVGYGCLTTKKETVEAKRLLSLYREVKVLLRKHKPEVLALEKLFFTTNAKTAFSVSQARGVIVLTAAEAKIPVFSYTPLQVKLAITGYGKAEKIQMQKMIKSILKLPEIPKPDDTADALAVALTHCFTTKIEEGLTLKD